MEMRVGEWRRDQTAGSIYFFVCIVANVRLHRNDLVADDSYVQRSAPIGQPSLSQD